MSIFVIIYFLLIIWIFYFFIFLTHGDRKHYYIKVVESIQFVYVGNSGISRVLCNVNTYQSIHKGLFFNSSPALDFKISLETPISIFISLRFSYNIKLMAFINISTNQIDSYILVVCQTTRPVVKD